MAKRVLLTGGTGFVGANLARHLLAEGHEVHLLVRQGHQGWRIAGLDTPLHVVDLQDAQNVQAAVGRIKPEWVFHLAAHGAYSWQTDVDQIMQTNLLGTVNLVQACLQQGFEAFVNTGSSSEYGFKDHAAHEETWLEPNSHYAVFKAAATLFCRYTAQKHHVPITTLRLYSVYGPYEDPGRLIPKLVMHGLEGTWPPLVSPETARDYIYIADVIAAYLTVAQAAIAPGAVYNVATGQQTTLREIVTVVREVLDVAAQPQWGTMDNRIWDTNVWVGNSQRLQSETDWQPQVSLRQGVVSTIEWFREHADLHPIYAD
ncbi:MAG: NAD-dependent epimerase/dehydratase family protein [Anaerolineales bacterium]